MCGFLTVIRNRDRLISRHRPENNEPSSYDFLCVLKKSATETSSARASFTMVAREGLRLPRKI